MVREAATDIVAARQAKGCAEPWQEPGFVDSGTYQPLVFLIAPLGFIRRTAARRISYAESLAFARVHQEVYEAYGHRLMDVPPGPVWERVALIEKHVMCPV
ncbi:AAA family ATPase [Micromonospora sp. NPDC049275]|uniref:AAA family ATPase n=1 Tax=Micromonospora sp. NPDC049275 TaxID=3364268 RepID=UPI003717841B